MKCNLLLFPLLLRLAPACSGLLRLTVLLLASSSLLTAQTSEVNPKEEKLSEPENAKQILAWSMEMVKNLPSYSATLLNEMPDGGMIRTQMSVKNHPDGTVWLRTEAKAESSFPMPSMIIIQNAEGMWQLVGNKAIKMAFATEQQKKLTSLFMEIDPASLVVPELQLAEKEVHKIPCWAITVKNSEKTLKEFEDMIQQQMPNLKSEMVKGMLPVITIQYIGKENGFPYGMESFNSVGTKISSQIYSEVNLDPNLENAYFQIPADYEVIVANSPQDMSQVMIDSMENKKAENRKNEK